MGVKKEENMTGKMQLMVGWLAGGWEMVERNKMAGQHEASSRWQVVFGGGGGGGGWEGKQEKTTVDRCRDCGGRELKVV
jgi:hypothetical protein